MIQTILFLIPFFILWILYDTISLYLYEGKQLAPKETNFY